MRSIKEAGGGPVKPIVTHKGKVVGKPAQEPATADVPTTNS
jgi:NosR/NirI family nitrous oxide reductase transcriptional regulator